MNTTPTNQTAIRTRRPIVSALVAVVTVITVGGTMAAAQTDPPPWEHCAYRHHPVAADVGPLLPVNAEESDELRAVLHGYTRVGTDCSIYDLPV